MHARALLLAALATSALAAPVPAAAQEKPWHGASVIDDPEWQARFLGSYGFLSGAEPDIREDEVEVLREVIELMKADRAAAAARLQEEIGDDSSAALDFVLANLYFQNDQLDAAARYYRSSIAKFPDFRRAHKNVGLLLVQQGDFDGALEHLSRAVELGDRDGRNYGLLGYAYVNRENYLSAEQAYRNAILQNPETKDWKIGLARCLLAMERWPEAIALFDELIAANPDDSTYWMLQANAYLGLERPAAAAVNLEAVRMMGKAQHSSLVLLGDIYMTLGVPELAKSAYLEVIEIDRGAARFETARRAASLLVRTRSFAEAEEILDGIETRYAGKLTHDQELEVMTLAAKTARGQGREKEAAKILETIVERDGTRGDALLELAAYYRAQDDLERALFLIERAENLEDYEHPALLTHAQLEVGRREYARAAELLRRAQQIKPEARVERFLAKVEDAARR
jgi:tetratricopeptide (TPR) repeat protein